MITDRFRAYRQINVVGLTNRRQETQPVFIKIHSTENRIKNRIIIAAAFTACLALCAAVWLQAETVEKTPAPSETTAVTTPRPTLPEAEKPVLPVVTEKKESEMLEAESAPEGAAEVAHPCTGNRR